MRYLSEMMNCLIIRNGGGSWAIGWILATISLFSGLFFNDIFYLFGLYLYLGAFLLLIYGWFEYAELNHLGVTIFVGYLFKRSSIRFKWESVKHLDIKYNKKEWRTHDKGVSDGAGPPFTIDSFDDDEVIEIELKGTLPIKDRNKIRATNKLMLKDRMALNENGTIIHLKEVPEISLKKFCEIAKLYKNGNSDLKVQNQGGIKKYIRIFQIIVFIVPVVICYLYLR
jgi:hypothetical protein